MNPIEKMISELTYKPGTKFQVNKNTVMFTMTTVDSEDPSRTVNLRLEVFYNPKDDPAMVLQRVFTMIYEMEMHEMQEWLKLRGVRINNPHEGRK